MRSWTWLDLFFIAAHFVHESCIWIVIGSFVPAVFAAMPQIGRDTACVAVGER